MSSPSESVVGPDVCEPVAVVPVVPVVLELVPLVVGDVVLVPALDDSVPSVVD